MVLIIGSGLIVSGCQTTGNKEGIGTAVGAALGGVVGSQFGSGSGQIVGTLIGVVAGGFLGNQLGKYLDEQDQEAMTVASQRAALTGETQRWSNPDTKTSGQARVVSTDTKTKKIKVPVLKSRVSEVPPLDIIGQTYRAKSNANLRGGPGTDYVKVGGLSGGETVNVVGKVKDKDWYLLSYDGVGSGFVWANLVEPAPNEKATAVADASGSEEVVEAEFTAEQTCKTVEQSVTLADGETVSDTVEACETPMGWAALSTS
jgi:outer membrane lipoprotein SlyB